jgi:hypothetical protein
MSASELTTLMLREVKTEITVAPILMSRELVTTQITSI